MLEKQYVGYVPGIAPDEFGGVLIGCIKFLRQSITGITSCAMNALLTQEVNKLSPSEKMHLAADLWDDIAAHAAALPVPAEHQRILDLRLSAHAANPASALSLEEFQRQLAAPQS